MLSKGVIWLAALALVGESVASNIHRHAQQHEKKEMITDIIFETEFVTVHETLIPDGPTSTAKPTIPCPTPPTTSSTTASSHTTTSTFVPVPRPSSTNTASAWHTTTTSPSVAPPPPPPPTPTTTSAMSTTTSAMATPTVKMSNEALPGNPGSGGPRRGLAYNDGSLLSPFLDPGTKMTWKYNWAQVDDSPSAHVEFVPMLWCSIPEHTNSWSSNAKQAIDNGAQVLLSFNEPDLASQCNISPEQAAADHQKWMNPFQGKVRISSPAITNAYPSPGNMVGTNWLSAWFAACGGQCACDVVAIHWYNHPDVGEFIQHARDVYAIAQRPVWFTEFQPIGASDAQIGQFLEDLFQQLASDPSLSFIERIAYFMVSEDNLVSSGSTLSTYGQIYAYH